MITTDHPLSEIIAMYHKLADMYDAGNNTIASDISNFVTRENLVRSLNHMNVDNILDAGGGTGNWALVLAEMGFDVTLLDISPEMLKIAEDKINRSGHEIRLIEGNIEQTPFENHEFDFVLAEGGVISLTPDPSAMMKEIKRITKPGGYVWIDYLNLGGWALLQPDVQIRSKLVTLEEDTIYMGRHEIPFRMFSPKKIRFMLYDAGFLEINEFGNGIITNPLQGDEDFGNIEPVHIKKSELAMSRNYIMTGAAFHIQVLAQKIIH